MAKSSPYQQKILEALQYQGDSNDCGPYTTATVINALREIQLDPAELSKEMNRSRWRKPLLIVRRISNWVTFPWGIVDVFRFHGLSASWRIFSSSSYLLEKLEDKIVLMPIIGSWKPLMAHVMTLIAWDESKGWGFANTQYNHREITWLPEDVFLTQWRVIGNILIQTSLEGIL